MLNILEKLLIAEVDAYQRLDHSTPPSQRQAACERFNRTNETFVILLSRALVVWVSISRLL